MKKIIVSAFLLLGVGTSLYGQPDIDFGRNFSAFSPIYNAPLYFNAPTSAESYRHPNRCCDKECQKPHSRRYCAKKCKSSCQ